MRQVRVRLHIYRCVFRALGYIFDRRLSGSDSKIPMFKCRTRSDRPTGGRPFYWVHASSAGELEGLETVALALAARGFAIRLTIFSPSAKSGFLRLKKILEDMGACEGGGFSPLEGSWFQAFSGSRPLGFITAKYEAWPELWASASMAQVPIMILGAQLRRSLIVADRVNRFLFGLNRPQLMLGVYSKRHRVQLDALAWSRATVFEVRDPRWDKVLGSSGEAQNSRSNMILSWAMQESLPRPWGMIGNSWMSDFRALPSLGGRECLGATLWVIPHEIQGLEVHEQEEYLVAQGWCVFRTSALTQSNKPILSSSNRYCILVDEIGVLKRIYREADLIFVGGGFGRGVHSVMEPAISGAPILAGPEGADRFVEVDDLIASGDLHIVRNEGEFAEFTKRPLTERFQTLDRKSKQESHMKRLGGTSDVLSVLFGA